MRKVPEPTVETTFEVYTVDWPSVQFDWKVLDRGLSVKELSRSKNGDETVIKFRVRMDAPVAQNTTTRYLILAPTDKRIKPLTIPVVCYRPSLRNSGLKGTESADVLRPERISLGVVPRNEDRHFRVSGPLKMANSLKVAGLDNLPERTKVEVHPIKDVAKTFGFTIHLDKSAPLGLFDGRIHLISSDGHKYSIAVLGIVGPEDSEKKSNEAKDRQAPSRQFSSR